MTNHEYPAGTRATVTLDVELTSIREYGSGARGYEVQFVDAEGDDMDISWVPLGALSNIVKPAPPTKEYKPGDVIDLDGPELPVGSIIKDGTRVYLHRRSGWHATSDVITKSTWSDLHDIWTQDFTYVGKI